MNNRLKSDKARRQYVTQMRRLRKKSNFAIIGFAGFTCALFLAMIVYFGIYSMTHEEELINNSFNARQQLLVEENRRGRILSRNGEILAESETGEDGKDIRKYPYGNLFAHSVGYTGNGKTGIESAANYNLLQSHISTSEKVQNDINGQKNPGDDVITSLDVALQTVASEALGIYKGAIVVSNPKTGEILAMVSKPDFDPEKIAEQWDDFMKDTESGRLINRASQGLYPPGSTCKIITALAYIRQNPDTYNKYGFTCKGYITSGDERINCYHGSVHGAEDLVTSFAKSCNASFANIGLSLDKKEYRETVDGLLFNSELPVQFIYGKSVMDISEDSTDADVMQDAIGQGRTLMSPLHLNLITQAVANDGVLMKPYLIRQVINADGNIIKDYQPEEYSQIMSTDESSILKGLMREVVLSGTGKKLKDASYSVAGKTGSAEYNGVKEDSHAWFTGFAPVEDPEIAVTVIIEGAGSGGDYAVPIAGRIFDKYFEK